MVQVVGCSGAVFGFMGLYVADMALNFRSLSFPWLRLIWIGATLAYFVVASVTQVSPPRATCQLCVLSQITHVPHESGAHCAGQAAARGLGSLVAWCQYPMGAELLLLCPKCHWAAWYITRLLVLRMPKGAAFCCLFPEVSSVLLWSRCYTLASLLMLPQMMCFCTQTKSCWKGCYTQLSRSTVCGLTPCGAGCLGNAHQRK